MSEQQPTTPVDQDLDATVAELQQRAAADYRAAQARRERLTREDRVHGNQPS